MAKKKFFGLFVGVDKYDAVPSLNGCVNDALKVYNYLDRALNRNEYDFFPKKLFSPHDPSLAGDALPTRQNILNSLKEYAAEGKFAAGDVFFFFYAGHGSTELAHPYFGEPNGEVQTLVPCDARTTGADGKKVRDVLDKEIRYVVNQIWEKSGKQVEIIIVQDSCHSTGATRSEINDTEKKIAAGLLELKKSESTTEQKTEFKDFNIAETEDGMPDFTGTVGSENVLENSQKEEVVLSDEEKPTMRMCPAFGKESTGNGDEVRGGVATIRDMSDMELFDEETKKDIEKVAKGEKIEETRSPFKTETTTNGETTRGGIVTTTTNSETTRGGTVASTGTAAEIPFDKKFPLGNHIHLAACEKNQYAYETAQSDGKKGGVFTDTLVKLLERSGGNISYHEIFNRAKSMIDGVFNQTPSLFIQGDQNKRYERFLGGKAVVKEGEFNVSVQKRSGVNTWVVDAGALHGLRLLRGDETIPLKVFSTANPTEVYSGKIDYVFAECSQIVFDEQAPSMDSKALYKAKIDLVEFVNYPLNIEIVGDTNPMHQYKDLPETEFIKTFVEWGGTAARNPFYQLSVVNNQFILTRKDSNQPVVFTPKNDTSKQAAFDLMAKLKNISRWHQLQSLYSPHPKAAEIASNHIFSIELPSNGGVLYVKKIDREPFYEWYFAKDFNSIGVGSSGMPVKKIILPKSTKLSNNAFKDGSAALDNYNFIARQKAGSTAPETNLYLGTLFLDYDYAINSLSDSGSALFPTYEAGKETQFKMALKIENKPSTTGFLKFMIAYKRFDPSTWLQDGLPQSAVDLEILNEVGATRAVLQLKAGTRAQDWIAYTLEVEFSTEVTTPKPIYVGS